MYSVRSCSFLVLLLRRQVEDRLAREEWTLEWLTSSDIWIVSWKWK